MRTAFRAGALAALAMITLAAVPTASAGPSDYVIPAVVEEGEREIDLKAGTAKARDGSGRESAYSLGLGLGATSWWFTEVYAKWKKEPGASSGFDAWEWENRFQLTPTGKYPVTVGALLEIERPRNRAEGYEYRWGPLLQADLTQQLQGNLNLLFEKHVRGEEGGKAELGYQWQLLYRWRPELGFGVQGFGDVGPWDHWEPHDEQPHNAGPVLYGRFRVGERQVVKYNVGWLRGLTDATPRNTLRMQAEFEF